MLRGVLLSVLLLMIGCCCGLPSLPNDINTSDQECIASSECPANQTCYNNKCEDPCVEGCGPNTDCELINNNPLCTCKPGFTGHPFTDGCSPAEVSECSSNSQCPAEEACLNRKCTDPCPGVCGLNTDCRVVNHRPFCACSRGFRWNTGKGCQPESSPECTSDALCAPTLACRRQHCVDPCAGVCGNNTVCQVTDHHPACACAPGYTGNPFEECKPQCSLSKMSTQNVTSVNRGTKLKKLFLHKEIMTWPQAVQYCRSRDMQLLTISSAEEQQQVEDVLSSEGFVHVWTSGMKLANLDQYLWTTTGNYLTYTNWLDGRPSGNFNCISLFSDSAKWTNFDCTFPLVNVMCEVYTQ